MSTTRPSISPDPQRRAAEQTFSAGLTAESLDKSAGSHDRTAKAFEEAAERSDRHKDEYGERAARHRGFAREDRRMAQLLRANGRK